MKYKDNKGMLHDTAWGAERANQEIYDERTKSLNASGLTRGDVFIGVVLLLGTWASYVLLSEGLRPKGEMLPALGFTGVVACMWVAFFYMQRINHEIRGWIYMGLAAVLVAAWITFEQMTK